MDRLVEDLLWERNRIVSHHNRHILDYRAAHDAPESYDRVTCTASFVWNYGRDIPLEHEPKTRHATLILARQAQHDLEACLYWYKTDMLTSRQQPLTSICPCGSCEDAGTAGFLGRRLSFTSLVRHIEEEASCRPKSVKYDRVFSMMYCFRFILLYRKDHIRYGGHIAEVEHHLSTVCRPSAHDERTY